MVLRGDDDHHGEDGAQHDGRDAHRQADEGEVAGLARGDLRRHHVPAGDRRAHLGDRWRGGGGGGDGACVWEEEQKLDRELRNRRDARVGASLENTAEKQIDWARGRWGVKGWGSRLRKKKKKKEKVRPVHGGRHARHGNTRGAGPVARRPVSSTQLSGE